MFTPLICGSNFQDDEEIKLLNLCSDTKKSSRRPTRRHSFGISRTRDTKNPYADRGLDKFSALLAELDSKRQKIYTQKGSEDISLLGFVYSNSSDYKPIVIRLRGEKQDRMKLKTENNIRVSDKGVTYAAKGLSRIESNAIKNEEVSFLWGDILKLRRPSYYVPVIMMLILVFLALFGRPFAILCTCLGWYVIPTIKTGGGGLDMKKSSVKGLCYNDHIIAGADHGLPSSPTSVLTGEKSAPRQGHGRSS